MTTTIRVMGEGNTRGMMTLAEWAAYASTVQRADETVSVVRA